MTDTKSPLEILVCEVEEMDKKELPDGYYAASESASQKAAFMRSAAPKLAQAVRVLSEALGKFTGVCAHGYMRDIHSYCPLPADEALERANEICEKGKA